jgi:MazG family protein
MNLVSTLRAPGGCPWDAQQTKESVKVYILEEAYEVLDAIERGSSQDLCQELGDLLFQILFLTSIGEDGDEFDLLQVMQKITKKMIDRHPHVFGNAKADSAKEVAENWEKIKKKEKGVAESSPSLLRDVLRKHVGVRDKEGIGEIIGTCLFHLADLARHWGWNAESLLRKANQAFLDRFQEEEGAESS